MKSRWLAVLAAAALLSLLGAAPAGAHLLGYDAVDSSEDIDYEDSTQYDTARQHAIDEWNALGGVDIQPDGAWTIQDLKWRDKDRSDVTWAGQYEYRWGLSDRITFNEYYMDGYSSSEKKNVAMHELGHALGLDHSYAGQVMYAYSSTVTTTQSHDESDYNSLW